MIPSGYQNNGRALTKDGKTRMMADNCWSNKENKITLNMKIKKEKTFTIVLMFTKVLFLLLVY